MDDTKDALLDRHGRPVKVKKIPTRGKAKTLFKSSSYDPTISPFERFSSTNCGRKFFSF